MPKEIFQKGKDNKNDEFYTQLSDIENEIKHYWPQLEGKKIWCNCDDPEWSNFYHFFTSQKAFHNFEVKFTSYRLVPENFEGYTLKKLDKTILKQEGGKGIIVQTNEVWVDTDGYCEGDFRAKAQEELWEWADVIITNPPFSLFKEFVDMIMTYNKKFLIIGGQNAISYKQIFKYIKHNQMWLGVNNKLTGLEKLNKDGEIEYISAKTSNLPNTCIWYTNLEHEKRNRAITLCDWEEGKFPKYINYEAYETVWTYAEPRRKRAEIPFTNKILGVPITYLHKYNPQQFEIVGASPTDYEPTIINKLLRLTGKTKDTITINRKGEVYIKTKKQHADSQNLETKEFYAIPFARIFIKLKDEYYEKWKEVYDEN